MYGGVQGTLPASITLVPASESVYRLRLLSDLTLEWLLLAAVDPISSPVPRFLSVFASSTDFTDPDSSSSSSGGGGIPGCTLPSVAPQVLVAGGWGDSGLLNDSYVGELVDGDTRIQWTHAGSVPTGGVIGGAFKTLQYSLVKGPLVIVFKGTQFPQVLNEVSLFTLFVCVCVCFFFFSFVVFFPPLRLLFVEVCCLFVVATAYIVCSLFVVATACIVCNVSSSFFSPISKKKNHFVPKSTTQKYYASPDVQLSAFVFASKNWTTVTQLSNDGTFGKGTIHYIPPTVPHAVTGFTMVDFGCFVLLLGGFDTFLGSISNEFYFGSVQGAQTRQTVWAAVTLPTGPMARSFAISALINSTKLLVLGGFSVEYLVQADAWTLDLEQGTWLPALIQVNSELNPKNYTSLYPVGMSPTVQIGNDFVFFAGTYQTQNSEFRRLSDTIALSATEKSYIFNATFLTNGSGPPGRAGHIAVRWQEGM